MSAAPGAAPRAVPPGPKRLQDARRVASVRDQLALVVRRATDAGRSECTLKLGTADGRALLARLQGGQP